MGTRSAVAGLAAEVRDSTLLPPLTFSQEHAPARLAASITAEMSEAFPPAGGRASGAHPVAVLPTVVAVDDTTNHTCLR
jgi:hypothetical protein